MEDDKADRPITNSRSIHDEIRDWLGTCAYFGLLILLGMVVASGALRLTVWIWRDMP